MFCNVGKRIRFLYKPLNTFAFALSPAKNALPKSFTTYNNPPILCLTKRFYDTNTTKRTKVMYAFTLATLLKFFGLAEEEDSELLQIIKKGELLYLKKNYQLSEQMYHVALKLAQDLQNDEAITFVYDRLANIAFDTFQNDKAMKLFKSVLQRLFLRGVKEDDLVVIHISFKLAKIFEYNRDFENAFQGFYYCVKKLEPKLTDETSESYQDAVNLWIMLTNGFAYFYYNIDRLQKALEYFEKSLEWCVKVNGLEYEQTILLLNSIGTVYSKMLNKDMALKYFEKAASHGRQLPDMKSLSMVYLNLAYIYMELGSVDEAKKNCQKAKINAERNEYKEGIAEAEECFKKILGLQEQNIGKATVS